MNNERIELLIADYLDDLLDTDDRVAAEAAMAAHPELVAQVAQRRARLYRPFAVAPPHEDLAMQIVARHNQRPRWMVARYAAVFMAGVLTMWMVGAANRSSASTSESPAGPGSSHTPTVADAPDIDSPGTDLDLENSNQDAFVMRRRIR